MEGTGLDQGSPTNILKDSGRLTLRKAEHGAPSKGTCFSGVCMPFLDPPPPPQRHYPGSNLRVAPKEYRLVRRNIPCMKAAPGSWTPRGANPP